VVQLNENVGELIVPGETVDHTDVELSHRSIFAGFPALSAGIKVYVSVTLYVDGEKPVAATFQ
jgi:hypothetical protein